MIDYGTKLVSTNLCVCARECVCVYTVRIRQRVDAESRISGAVSSTRDGYTIIYIT